jgi:hypothetical protein
MNTLISDVYIVDGNITIFLGAHSDTFKTNILHSSLFGQLVANSSTTENSTPDTWFTSYKKTLGSLFWSLISNQNLESKKKTYSIYTLAESGLSSLLNEKQFAQLASAFSVITVLPKDAQVIKAILQKTQKNNLSPVNSNNTPHNEETFTIATLLTIVLENKTLASLYLSFKTTGTVDINILDRAIPQKQLIGDPASTTWCAYLVEGSYATISSDITKKISKHIESKILHVTATPSEVPGDFLVR